MYSRGQFSDITITICGIMGQSDADPGAFITNMFLILGKADLQTNLFFCFRLIASWTQRSFEIYKI